MIESESSEIENSVSCRQSIYNYLVLYVKSMKGRYGMHANIINSSTAVMSLYQSSVKKNKHDLLGTFTTIQDAAIAITVLILIVNYSSRFNLATLSRSQFIRMCDEFDQTRNLHRQLLSYRGNGLFLQSQPPQEKIMR